MTPALTTPELAERLDLDLELLELILLDSQRLGLVRRDEHGRWALTPRTEARYGRALRAIGPAAAGDDDGGASRPTTPPHPPRQSEFARNTRRGYPVIERRCPACGAPVDPWAHGRRRFCVECSPGPGAVSSAAWRRAYPEAVAAYNEGRRLPRVPRACATCGAMFTGRSKRVYCSPDCRERRRRGPEGGAA